MTRYIFIDYIKTIACLLIINTHSATLFPKQISFLSFGGDVGNDLFFMATGFLLYNSIRETSEKNFYLWLKKRAHRVLPVTTVFNIINIMIDEKYKHGLLECIKILTIPNGYWFVCSTIIISCFLFLYGKVKIKEIYKIILIVSLLILHIVLDTGLGSFSERYIAGAISAIIGFETHNKNSKKTKTQSLLFSIMYFVLFVVLKIKCIGIFNVYTHALQTILILMFNYNLFMFFKKKEENKELIETSFIELISKNSLYAYLFGTKRIIELFDVFIFPINYVACASMIIIMANLIGQVVRKK